MLDWVPHSLLMEDEAEAGCVWGFTLVMQLCIPCWEPKHLIAWGLEIDPSFLQVSSAQH